MAMNLQIRTSVSNGKSKQGNNGMNVYMQETLATMPQTSVMTVSLLDRVQEVRIRNR